MRRPSLRTGGLRLRLSSAFPAARRYKLRKDRRVAEVLFLAAMSGDVAAIKEINDRLDGKVTQTHDANITGAMNVTVVFADD
jgi:hypothetical protein